MKEILIKAFVEARLEIPINSILLTLTKPSLHYLSESLLTSKVVFSDF